jgi:hypothetical protein
VPVVITVECRRRGQREDCTWIEQLIEKKRALAVAKTIAVSEKGFSEEARKIAATGGIELRRLTDITSEAIRHWLSADTVTIWSENCQFDHLGLNLADRAPGEELNAEIGHRELLFTFLPTRQRVSAFDLLTAHLRQHPQAFDQLAWDGKAVTQQMYAPYTDGTLSIDIGDRARPVVGLFFHVTLTRSIIEAPMDHLFDYSTGDQPVVQGAEGHILVSEFGTILSLLRDPHTGAVLIGRAPYEVSSKALGVFREEFILE